MVCEISLSKKPLLNNPVLIEGLPGIGFVANIAALHLIQQLNATLFAEIRCSSFQDFAVTVDKGQMNHPINALYYYEGKKEERDVIILYGNTQALTATGQYELCGRILDFSEELGCRFVITLGGFKREQKVSNPKLFFAATDVEMAKRLTSLGAEIIKGQIFGVAGLLIGLAKLRNLQGFCLLAETLGLYPDIVAARKTLNIICPMLNLKIDLKNLDNTVEITRNLLGNFGLIEQTTSEEREESQFRHYV